LLDAWEHLPDVPLTMIGGGPLLAETRRRVASPNLRHVSVTGELPHDEVLEMIEARAKGKPAKQPMFIHRLDGEPLAVAGLWEAWKDPGDPDGPPMKSGISLVDLSGGYASAIAIV